MSQSNQKRKRQELRSDGSDKFTAAQKKADEEKKKNKRVTIIISIVLVVLIAAIAFINSSLLYRTLPAITIEGEDYTAAEFNYFYYSAFYSFANQYGEWLPYLIDTSKPLASQWYSEDEGITWADYFSDTAIDNIKVLTMQYNEAVAAGYTATQADKDQVDNAIKNMEDTYALAGYSSLAKYLTASYGKGVTVNTVRDILEKSVMATSFATQVSESFEYSAEELEAYYNEHKDEYDVISFRKYFVDGSVPEEPEAEDGEEDEPVVTDAPEITEEPDVTENPDSTVTPEATGEPDSTEEPETTDNPPEDTDAPQDESGDDENAEEEDPAKAAAMAAAKEIADLIKAETTDEDSFNALVLDAVPEESKESYESDPDLTKTDSRKETITSTVYGEWLLDAGREADDVEVFEDGTGYTVIYFINRDDNHYNTRNIRHLLVKAVEAEHEHDEEEPAELDEQLREDAKAASLARAEELYAEWQAGDKTEDSFAEMANEYSDDAGSNTKGGLYENVAKGDMVAEFDAFCYDPDMKPGDTGIVYGESGSYYGYHIMYYVGEGKLYSDVIADSLLRQEAFSAWQQERLENISVEQKFAFKFTA